MFQEWFKRYEAIIIERKISKNGYAGVASLIENLIDEYKHDKYSLDILQLRLITDYLIMDREFDEDYIDELEKELEQYTKKVEGK